MNRREFFGWVGVGALASSLPVVIAACNPQTEEQAQQSTTESEEPEIDTSVGEDGYQAIATTEQLESQGSVIEREVAAEAVLVFENPETGNVAAVNPTCTHQGCTVEWQPDDQIFACPCHGSRFSPGGEAIEGPATEPLATFPAKVEGDQILVKVS